MDVGSVRQHDFRVDLNEQAAEGVWRLVISSEVARGIKPGQFMNVFVPGDGSHILRIPLSFKVADPVKGTVELLYAVVGEGTSRLSQMSVSDCSTLLGPCGNGWWLPEVPGSALLVAGGIGLPPVLAAAKMLSEASVSFDLVVGARTASMLLQDDLDEAGALVGDGGRILVCTDDGSSGERGFTTDLMRSLLQERSYTQVYTCGPSIMMAGVARLAAEADITCQASLERMMGCGFGACSCCNVPLVSGGYALCCTDGPVFDAREVVW